MEKAEKRMSLWEIIEQASIEVAGWPEWKRRYSANPNLRDHSSDPEDRKKPLQTNREQRS